MGSSYNYGTDAYGFTAASNYPPSTSVNSGSGSANPPSTETTPGSSTSPSWSRFQANSHKLNILA